LLKSVESTFAASRASDLKLAVNGEARIHCGTVDNGMFQKQACISGMNGPESVFCATVVIIVGTPNSLAAFAST
jgi:hypothetical protein